ncbi:MAG: S9 family peptidase [Acidobacteria bacterium]|nr:S9 family peptidase [Acidobacteriota bacterium]
MTWTQYAGPSTPQEGPAQTTRAQRWAGRAVPLLLAVMFTIAGSSPGRAQPGPATRAMTTGDLIAMDRLSDLQVSPDGQDIAFVVSALDLDADRRRTDIWTVPVAGGSPRRETNDPASDFNPRWSPDGEHLYFLSTRSGSSQVWRLEVGDERARQVSDLPLDVSNLTLSPDGSHVAVSMEVFVDCDTLNCTAERLAERERTPATGQVYDGVFVRHWDTWEDGRRSHVFVMPTDGGTPVDTMARLDADAPSVPFGGAEEFAFTPDGAAIVLTTRVAGGGEPWSTNFDLYVSPVDGSRPPLALTVGNEAWDTAPTFSPDGATLAYLAMERPGFESDRLRIMLRDWRNGVTRAVAPDWDRSPSRLLWSADGTTLYATAENLGHVSLFAIDVATGAVATLLDKLGYVGAPALAGDRLVFELDHLRSPVEVFTAAHDGTDLRQITRFNDGRLAQLSLGEHEQFSFAGAGGDTVYAQVVKPAGFDPGRTYPVAFLIHGGPQGSFGNHFHYRWNPQSYAAAGYAVVMVDFHGSVGYGQAFTDAIRGDWGGKPLEDLQLGLAAALDRYPWMDGENACALGASYGGFMVNWIAGNWPERFKCLVNHDGLFDMRSMYYSTEELWFPEWEHGGPYFQNPEDYEKHNPAHHVEAWRTPMLVIHGQQDHRVPLEQGLSTFNALQRRGIPSRFLFFPDENHWVLKPHNSLQWHETVLEWLDRWLKEESTTP